VWRSTLVNNWARSMALEIASSGMVMGFLFMFSDEKIPSIEKSNGLCSLWPMAGGGLPACLEAKGSSGWTL